MHTKSTLKTSKVVIVKAVVKRRITRVVGQRKPQTPMVKVEVGVEAQGEVRALIEVKGLIV